jgi:hypothetical protein
MIRPFTIGRELRKQQVYNPGIGQSDLGGSEDSSPMQRHHSKFSPEQTDHNKEKICNSFGTANCISTIGSVLSFVEGTRPQTLSGYPDQSFQIENFERRIAKFCQPPENSERLLTAFTWGRILPPNEDCDLSRGTGPIVIKLN